MKHLIIIGARGAGRETFLTATKSFGYGHEFDIKGFLDGKTDALDGLPGYPPILSSVESYQVEEDDVFVCALGDPKWRKHYADIILNKSGKFITLIDKTARIGRNAKIGNGCIIRDYAMISCDVNIGDYTYIQPFAVIGHDSVVGNYCHLNTYAFMGGYSSMGDMAIIHTRGTLIPHKKMGMGAIIGAGSVAMTNVKCETTVVGIPAKRIKG
ncbi:MAG: acetyltransferase [Bacteroidaceae bacterium]|nr:acetyltransferase [Bacteroidaceae bacterium]